MKSVIIGLLAMASVGLLIGAFFIVRSGFEKHQQDQEVQKEINTLMEQAESLENKSTKLSEKIEYFKTSDFKEKLAKEKLNYKKEGEEMVVIKPSTLADQREESIVAEGVSDRQEESEIPNYKKWWNYFFGTQ